VRRYADGAGDVLVLLKGDQVTSTLSEPVTDLEVAKRVAREISEMANQRDGTIIVRSRRIEHGGRAEWRGIAAVFINGEEIAADDERYPREFRP
jgi:hypothetical protein